MEHGGGTFLVQKIRPKKIKKNEGARIAEHLKGMVAEGMKSK